MAKTHTPADLDRLMADALNAGETQDAEIETLREDMGRVESLVKGMTDGMRELVSFIKADEDGLGEEEGEEMEGEGEDEDEDEDEELAGFDDLAKSDDGDDWIDAAPYLQNLEKGICSVLSEIRVIASRVDNLEKGQRTLAKGIVSTAAPLAKGVAGITEILDATPAAVHNPGLGARARQVHGTSATASSPRSVGPLPFDGTDKNGISREKLSKALQDGEIHLSAFRSYKTHGRFCSDNAENSALVNQIRKIKTPSA